jgi:hypothetical protein
MSLMDGFFQSSGPEFSSDSKQTLLLCLCLFVGACIVYVFMYIQCTSDSFLLECICMYARQDRIVYSISISLLPWMERIVRSSQCILLTKPKGEKIGGNENYSRAEEASQAMSIG